MAFSYTHGMGTVSAEIFTVQHDSLEYQNRMHAVICYLTTTELSGQHFIMLQELDLFIHNPGSAQYLKN